VTASIATRKAIDQARSPPAMVTVTAARLRSTWRSGDQRDCGTVRAALGAPSQARSYGEGIGPNNTFATCRPRPFGRHVSLQRCAARDADRGGDRSVTFFRRARRRSLRSTSTLDLSLRPVGVS
jgi:hypothetical protein